MNGSEVRRPVLITDERKPVPISHNLQMDNKMTDQLTTDEKIEKLPEQNIASFTTDRPEPLKEQQEQREEEPREAKSTMWPHLLLAIMGGVLGLVVGFIIGLAFLLISFWNSTSDGPPDILLVIGPALGVWGGVYISRREWLRAKFVFLWNKFSIVQAVIVFVFVYMVSILILAVPGLSLGGLNFDEIGSGSFVVSFIMAFTAAFFREKLLHYLESRFSIVQGSLSLSNLSIKRFNTYFKAYWICAVAGIPLSFFLIGIPILIIGVAFGAMLLYQCWKLIPADIARTTPGKAVGYSFIPFFNLYWFFVAFKGLGEDMNETLRQRGIQFEVNSVLGTVFCRLTLVGFCLGTVFFFGVFLHDTDIARGIGNFLAFSGLGGSILCNITAIVVCIVFLKSIKDSAVVLLEPERANQIQSEKEVALALLTKVMGRLSALKEAAQARVKLNTINAQLIAAYRSLGDAAEQSGWDGVLCESIRKQREEVATMVSQQEKAVSDAEMTQNTPAAWEAKQALAEAKKRTAFVSGVLDGLREKAGRKLFDDVTAPDNIGTEQRIEIARLTEEIKEYERIIAHGKSSLLTKPMLVAASVMVLLVVGVFGMVTVFSVTKQPDRKAPRYSSSPEYSPASPTRQSSQEHRYQGERGSFPSGMSEREARDFREENRAAAARREGELNIKECGICEGTGRYPFRGSTCSLCEGRGFLWTNRYRK